MITLYVVPTNTMALSLAGVGAAEITNTVTKRKNGCIHGLKPPRIRLNQAHVVEIRSGCEMNIELIVGRK